MRMCLPSNVLTQTYHFLSLRCYPVFVLNMERLSLLLRLTAAVLVLSICLVSEQMIIKPHQTVCTFIIASYVCLIWNRQGYKSLMPRSYYTFSIRNFYADPCLYGKQLGMISHANMLRLLSTHHRFNIIVALYCTKYEYCYFQYFLHI